MKLQAGYLVRGRISKANTESVILIPVASVSGKEVRLVEASTWMRFLVEGEGIMVGMSKNHASIKVELQTASRAESPSRLLDLQMIVLKISLRIAELSIVLTWRTASQEKLHCYEIQTICCR